MLTSQLVLLVGISTLQWSRHALTADFAFYSQMWWKIGHGHLDPYSTVFRIPAIRNNLELIMWPLALLQPLVRSALALLYLQDLALVATGWAALQWIDALTAQHRTPGAAGRSRLGLCALVAVALDPWCYQTALFDFHLHSFAGLFAVLLGWDLWAGRDRRAWLWAVLLISTGPVGMLALIGVAAATLLRGGSRRRRHPASMLAIGAAVLIGADQLGYIGQAGRVSRYAYGYLDTAKGSHPTLLGDLLGIGSHLSTIGSLVVSRLPVAALFLLPVGIVGAFTRRAAPVVLAVFLPPLLSIDGRFFRVQAAFQIWPALAFVLVATCETLSRHAGSDGQVGRLGGLFRQGYPAVAWMTVLPLLFAMVMERELPYWIGISPAAAAALGRVEATIPADAEVLAPNGIVGTLGPRRYVYCYSLLSPASSYPAAATTVVFLYAPSVGIPSGITGAEAASMLKAVLARPDASIRFQGQGITEVVWHPVPLAGRFRLQPKATP